MKRKIRCGGKPMSVIVLAGGRGRRMKADKAGLPVGGRTLLEHVLGQLGPYFEEILVSVSPGQTIRLNAAAETGTPVPGKRPAVGPSRKPRVIEDETPGLGPLGGIMAGLKAATNEACAVVACDMPDIDIPLFRDLARAAAGTDVAVPVGPAGRYEPLLAVYRRAVVPEIETLLRSGVRSVIPLFDRCRTAVVRLENAGRLRNLNTRADYREYLKTIGRTGRREGAAGRSMPQRRPRRAVL